MNDKLRKSIPLSPQQRAEHQAIRDALRTWHPGPEELIASGEAARLGLDVIHSPAHELVRQLKIAREEAALTLADVSARCGIDRATLVSLEDGHAPNLTLDTLWRYAAAIGKRLVLSAENVPDTRQTGSSSQPKRLGSKSTRKQGAR